jgi:predicted kinase
MSFAGKSTLARQLVGALDAELISLDIINAERGLDGGQGIPLEEWAETNRLARSRAAQVLGVGRDVVVDDTGTPRFVRDSWREVAGASGTAFALVWVRIDRETQRERVVANRANLRRADVIDEVLDAHRGGFEAPDDESPIVIDASETQDRRAVNAVVEAIRSAGNEQWRYR